MRNPGAHRAHITLAELGIPFEEEIIDLSTPRTPEYLKVNPRGLVPSLSYNGEILTESAVVAQFLADTYPSHLLPASTDPNGALIRARIAFFVDAWFTKVNSFWFKALFAKTAEDANESAEELVKGIVKEIEPLLKDAGPFFGGSNKLTFAEASRTPSRYYFQSPADRVLGIDRPIRLAHQDLRQGESALHEFQVVGRVLASQIC